MKILTLISIFLSLQLNLSAQNTPNASKDQPLIDSVLDFPSRRPSKFLELYKYHADLEILYPGHIITVSTQAWDKDTGYAGQLITYTQEYKDIGTKDEKMFYAGNYHYYVDSIPSKSCKDIVEYVRCHYWEILYDNFRPSDSCFDRLHMYAFSFNNVFTLNFKCIKDDELKSDDGYEYLDSLLGLEARMHELYNNLPKPKLYSHDCIRFWDAGFKKEKLRSACNFY